MCTDLANDPAPAGTAPATLCPDAFKRWMGECGYQEVDDGNPGQVVVMLYKGAEVTQSGIRFYPNWHITAMTDRQKTIVSTFHFKIEATKAVSHYWHYVLHYDGINRTWHWVGAPTPNLVGRNDAGGGAAGNLQALLANLTLVTLQSRLYDLENQVTRKTQRKMLTVLNRMGQGGWISLRGAIWY